MNNKKKVREKIKKIREAFDKIEKEKLSKIISEKFLELNEFKNSKNIMSYMDFKNEIETKYIHDKIKKLGKNLILPKIFDENIIPIKENGNFSNGYFSIKEPSGDIYTGEIDLIIIPGIAFNLSGDRIGFGKGFYDRFISNSKYKSAKKISLAYDFQITDEFEGEKFDKKIDILISEKRILKF